MIDLNADGESTSNEHEAVSLIIIPNMTDFSSGSTARLSNDSHQHSSGVSASSGGLQMPAIPYDYPHDKSFSPETTALVVIDMQRDFCEKGGYFDEQGYDIAPVRAIISIISELISAFRKAKFPIYSTREGHRSDLSTLSSRELFRSRNNPKGKGIGDAGPLGRFLIRGEPGHDIIPELHPPKSEMDSIIDKPGRSAFAHTEFEHMLRLRGVRNLVFVGVTTDVCVHSTMREANDRGFDCLLVEDACTAATEELHRFAVESVKSEGGIFGTVSKTINVIEKLKRWE